MLHANPQSRCRRVSESANFGVRNFRVHSSFVEENRRDAKRRLPSTQRDLIHLLPRLLPVFACVYRCGTLRIHIYKFMEGRRVGVQVVVSRAYERNARKREKEREKNRRTQIERKRRSETALAREQGCMRALFACVYDVNIIRQTHLNRLKILTSTSRPPPLCELFACDFIEVRLATSLCRQRGNARPNYTVRGHLVGYVSSFV